MKKLLSTTALVVALGLPNLTLAQTKAPATNPAHQQNAGNSGFLDQRSQSDLFASELMGHDVYARKTATDKTKTNTATNTPTTANNTDTRTQGMATITRADRDGMDNIGEINEIILSSDGQVRAIVIGAGGFLGMGEHDVAVSMDQITFATDADDRSEMYIIVNTGTDMLRKAPAYDRMSMTTNGTQKNAAPLADKASDRTAVNADGTQKSAAPRVDKGADRTAFAAPRIKRDGYQQVEVTKVSTDMITGKSVYDVNDNDVGTVTDMIIDDKGKITNVIIDFGGFLGMGSSQASLNYDELTILSTDGYKDVRIYVDATKKQIQDLPQYKKVTN